MHRCPSRSMALPWRRGRISHSHRVLCEIPRAMFAHWIDQMKQVWSAPPAVFLDEWNTASRALTKHHTSEQRIVTDNQQRVPETDSHAPRCSHNNPAYPAAPERAASPAFGNRTCASEILHFPQSPLALAITSANSYVSSRHASTKVLTSRATATRPVTKTQDFVLSCASRSFRYVCCNFS